MSIPNRPASSAPAPAFKFFSGAFRAALILLQNIILNRTAQSASIVSLNLNLTSKKGNTERTIGRLESPDDLARLVSETRRVMAGGALVTQPAVIKRSKPPNVEEKLCGHVCTASSHKQGCCKVGCVCCVVLYFVLCCVVVCCILCCCCHVSCYILLSMLLNKRQAKPYRIQNSLKNISFIKSLHLSVWIFAPSRSFTPCMLMDRAGWTRNREERITARTAFTS